MLLYLAPMLLVLVGAMRTLRRFQERTGRLPNGINRFAQGQPGAFKQTQRQEPKSGGLMSRLIAGFRLTQGRERAGTNIRLVESMPVGGSNLHLIDVRGRMLLIGATGAGVTLLAEFDQDGNGDAGQFRALLQAAGSDLESLDLIDADLPTAALVGALDDVMRETGESVDRRIRRLRTVSETERTCE